jgi:lysylphosphatidylglycerol synthetase-like protein (DUF2156 family)
MATPFTAGACSLDPCRRRSRTQEAPVEVVELVRRYGGPVSLTLFDPAYRRFEVPEIDGTISYREAWGCVVAAGEPVCAPNNALWMALRFRECVRSKGGVVVFVGTGEAFARAMAACGASAIAFGSELHLNPRLDPARGPKGRELRKKLTHAHRAGLCVGEYDRRSSASVGVEDELERVAGAWTANRHGLQVFLTTGGCQRFCAHRRRSSGMRSPKWITS